MLQRAFPFISGNGPTRRFLAMRAPRLPHRKRPWPEVLQPHPSRDSASQTLVRVGTAGTAGAAGSPRVCAEPVPGPSGRRSDQRPCTRPRCGEGGRLRKPRPFDAYRLRSAGRRRTACFSCFLVGCLLRHEDGVSFIKKGTFRRGANHGDCARYQSGNEVGNILHKIIAP